MSTGRKRAGAAQTEGAELPNAKLRRKSLRDDIAAARSARHKGERRTKTGITNAKRGVLARTGMLPLDFLVAVYRDDLWTSYTREFAREGRTAYFIPHPSAKRIRVDLDQRISAANAALPYFHKKLPQGLEITDAREKEVTAALLRELPPRELEELRQIMKKLDERNTPASLKQAVIMAHRTFDAEGKEVEHEPTLGNLEHEEVRT